MILEQDSQEEDSHLHTEQNNMTGELYPGIHQEIQTSHRSDSGLEKVKHILTSNSSLPLQISFNIFSDAATRIDLKHEILLERQM